MTTTKPTPYAFTLLAPRVGIDPIAMYGYWERKDGAEGGGLWFGPCGESGSGLTSPTGLELLDYDGAACLPRPVSDAIRGLGIAVDPEFF